MISARGTVKRVTVRGVVTKADGTVVDLGVIGQWHRNPLVRLAWRLRGISVSARPSVNT